MSMTRFLAIINRVCLSCLSIVILHADSSVFFVDSQDVQWNSVFGEIVKPLPRWAFLDSLNAFVTSTFVEMFLMGTANTYPDAPCREYLPIFPLECGYVSSNVGKSSMHGASGIHHPKKANGLGWCFDFFESPFQGLRFQVCWLPIGMEFSGFCWGKTLVLFSHTQRSLARSIYTPEV